MVLFRDFFVILQPEIQDEVLRNRIIIALAAAVACAAGLRAEVGIDYSATLAAGCADSQLAPYHLSAMNGGRFTQGNMLLLGLDARHAMNDTTRWSWGAGVELWGGATRRATYQRYDATTGQYVDNRQRPAAFWVQQLYVTGRYRCMTLTVGQRERRSYTVGRNSSGDFTRSGNARPLPGVEIHFDRYRDVPLTRGWLQATMELSFYHGTDSDWLRDHYVRRGSFLTTGSLMTYKALYLRTKPSQPVVATIGIQAMCQYGGDRTFYDLDGNVTGTEHMKRDFVTILKSIIPAGDGKSGSADSFCVGNHVGSIDVAVDWHIGSTGKTLRAYLQNPFEDGSGMAKRNGWDGLYGLEYRGGDNDIVSNAVVEYLDLTNQSGPLHWAPADMPGTKVTHQATGADDYYNNYAFNGYHTAGMSVGSPMVVAPLWNRDGFMQFTNNVMRGVHIAVEGRVSGPWRYRAAFSHRRAWGTPLQPVAHSRHATCAMLEVAYTPASAHGLAAKCRLAIDRGDLLGNNVGAMMTLSYNGNFTLGR